VHNEPMSGDKIKGIRKEIYKTLGIKIDYEHILFQMLKRGIGIYVDGMPNEYNWIVQKLLASREIGIVVSDRSLCLGIDLPIRTSCIMGYKDSIFTNDDYLQMSGRAGRRGHDTKGNIIFYNSPNTNCRP
jgi:superfamily II RNA helicase